MKLTLLLATLLGLTSCGLKYQQDNAIEEIAELGLESWSGVKPIDLSPATPETGFSPKHLLPFEKK